MSLNEALSNLPDDASVTVTLTVRELREALHRESPDRALSTAEASEEFGHSPTWWGRRASQVPGSYQAGGSRWSLPISGCRAYLAGLQGKKTRKGRRGLRGPYRTAHPDGVPQGPVLRHEPQALGRREFAAEYIVKASEKGTAVRARPSVLASQKPEETRP